MNEFVKQVTEFQKTFDPENYSESKFRLENMPVDKGQELIKLRYKLITEEVGELGDALSELCVLYEGARERHQSIAKLLTTNDAANSVWKDAKREVADALGDILVVVIGTALAFGLDIEEIMRRIHKSNMSKLGVGGKPIYRKDGKVMKGPDYEPPYLEDLV